jgi:hypothetical protein
VCSSGGHEDRERPGGEFMRFEERDFIFTERQISTERHIIAYSIDARRSEYRYNSAQT